MSNVYIYGTCIVLFHKSGGNLCICGFIYNLNFLCNLAKFPGRGLYFGVSGLTEKCELSFVNTLNALTQLWLCLGVRFDLNILFYALNGFYLGRS